jgi:hypothetical protein
MTAIEWAKAFARRERFCGGIYRVLRTHAEPLPDGRLICGVVVAAGYEPDTLPDQAQVAELFEGEPLLVGSGQMLLLSGEYIGESQSALVLDLSVGPPEMDSIRSP